MDTPRPGPPRAPAALWLAAYLAAYIGLDAISYIRPVAGLNITPWNPQQALAIGLLIWRPRAGLLVFAGLVLADLVIRGQPASPIVLLAAAATLTVAFVGIARALRRAIDPAAPLSNAGDLLRFAAIAVGGSLLSALLYVLVHASHWSGKGGEAGQLVLRYWVGDAVGLLVTLPVLLLLVPEPRRNEVTTVVREPVWWLCTALTGIALVTIFGHAGQEYFKYFYLLLPPVVWSAVRFGVAGAALSSFATQVGLLAGAQLAVQQEATVFELQVLMAATAVTALLLGVAIDERARAESELRTSLRFSAAGQMAAALAHELSQPITALNNYADACKALADGATPLDASRSAQLQHAIDKIVTQARLTASINRRLRDFFRTGATSLQPTSIEPLLQETLAAHGELAGRLGVRLECEVAAPIPVVRLDRIQFAVVLRNLVANAIESASGSADARVAVRAWLGAEGVRVDVVDSGPGLDASRARSAFEAAGSGKPQGLGVGLSICRSLLEAHGGKLWAEAAREGRFCILLPTEAS